jgi:hypothetical protein
MGLKKANHDGAASVGLLAPAKRIGRAWPTDKSTGRPRENPSRKPRFGRKVHLGLRGGALRNLFSRKGPAANLPPPLLTQTALLPMENPTGGPHTVQWKPQGTALPANGACGQPSNGRHIGPRYFRNECPNENLVKPNGGCIGHPARFQCSNCGPLVRSPGELKRAQRAPCAFTNQYAGTFNACAMCVYGLGHRAVWGSRRSCNAIVVARHALPVHGTRLAGVDWSAGLGIKLVPSHRSR